MSYALNVLYGLLNDLDLFYYPEADHLVIPFVFSGNNLFYDEASVDLIASAGEERISIEMNLIALDEEEQAMLDAALMVGLLTANYDMDYCKFALAPYGLSLLIDFDAYTLDRDQMQEGIYELFDGFDMYLMLLADWFHYLNIMGMVSVDEFYFDDLHDEGYFEDEYYWDEFGAEQRMPAIDTTSMDTKGQIFRSLLGVAKLGVTAATLGGIASTLGVPAAGIGAIMVALAQKGAGTT